MTPDDSSEDDSASGDAEGGHSFAHAMDGPTKELYEEDKRRAEIRRRAEQNIQKIASDVMTTTEGLQKSPDNSVTCEVDVHNVRDPGSVRQENSITNENDISSVKDNQESQDVNNISKTDIIKEYSSEKDDDSNAASISDKDKTEMVVDDQEMNKDEQNSVTANEADANLSDKT